MQTEPLRFAAFGAYLVAWVVLVIGAAASVVPRVIRQRRGGSRMAIGPASMLGSILQVASAPMITLRLGDQPLRPQPLELVGVTALAPLAACLFIWALLSAARDSTSTGLVTTGVYAFVRHPIYLAFLLMLIATGLLASAGHVLLWAIAVYIAGSEMRVSEEEKLLAKTKGAEYEQYRFRTRWRYIPGLR